MSRRHNRCCDPCCEPCCEPCCQPCFNPCCNTFGFGGGNFGFGGCGGGFGSSGFGGWWCWIVILIALAFFFCKKDGHGFCD